MGRIESFLEDTNGVLISGQAVPSLLLLDSLSLLPCTITTTIVPHFGPSCSFALTVRLCRYCPALLLLLLSLISGQAVPSLLLLGSLSKLPFTITTAIAPAAASRPCPGEAGCLIQSSARPGRGGRRSLYQTMNPPCLCKAGKRREEESLSNLESSMLVHTAEGPTVDAMHF